MFKIVITIPKQKGFVLDNGELRKVIRQAGAEVARRARALIRSGGKGRTPVPDGPPVSRTGLLASSIKLRIARNGESISIVDTALSPRGTHAPYALFLEVGAKGGVGSGRKGVKGKRGRKRGEIVGSRILAPHPFLSTAVDQAAAAGLAERVRDAVISGLKFQSLK